jgi:hypothetical protein
MPSLYFTWEEHSQEPLHRSLEQYYYDLPVQAQRREEKKR